MKVLIDLRSINYGRSGGIENYAYYVIDSLRDKDVEMILDVSPHSKDFYSEKYLEYKNLNIICDPILNFVYRTINFLSPKKINYVGRRSGWAKKQTVDVVYCPNHMALNQHTHLPSIFTMHAFLPDASSRYDENVISNVHTASALITSWNYPYQEFIKKLPDCKKKWFLLPYIAMHNIDSTKQEAMSELTRPFFLYVAFFSERKNHLKLVKGYALAKKDKPELPELVLVGSGNNDYKNQVRALVLDLQLNESVKIYDYLPDTKISYLYHNCEAILSPTLWEAASGVVLEGVFCGKPVACSDVPPLKDFADFFKLDILFFDPNSESSIAKRIIDLVEQKEENHKRGIVNKSKILSYFSFDFGDELIKIFHFAINNSTKDTKRKPISDN